MVASADTALLVFCKAPVPGQVKTRLVPYLSAEQAAELHIRLTRSVLDKISREGDFETQLWCSPSVEHAFFAECASQYNVTLHAQRGADLGERMHNALAFALDDYRHALLIGCDCPSLKLADLQLAARVLRDGGDVVLGPAKDGGYVLIGMNSPQPEIFEHIEWGTANVLQATRDRIARLGLQLFELKEQWDIDRPEDYIRLSATTETLQSDPG